VTPKSQPLLPGLDRSKSEGIEYRQRAREGMAKKLDGAGAPDLARVLRRCAEPLELVCLTCGTGKIVDTGCRKRWCPVCAHKIAARKVNRYRYAIERMTSPLFLTLTIRSSEYAREGLVKLKEDWFAFRRTKWWKACGVRGGIYGIELTWGSGGWHPHLHILLDCDWLTCRTPAPHRGMTAAERRETCRASQVELSEAWARQTGQDISIVWVKKANIETVSEVVKYSLKPEDLSRGDRPMVEAIRCLQGLRMCATWGSCYGLAKEADVAGAKDRPACECPGCSQPDWMPYEAAVGKNDDGSLRGQGVKKLVVTRQDRERWAAEDARVDSDGMIEIPGELTGCVAVPTEIERTLHRPMDQQSPKNIRTRAYKLVAVSNDECAAARVKIKRS